MSNQKIHRALIRALIEYPENIEVYLYIHKRVIPFMTITNIMYTLSIFDQLSFYKSIEDCKFLRILNPLKISILILELVHMIRLNAYQVKTKCDQIFEKYMKLALALINETNDRKILEALFKDKDLDHREVIYITSINDFLDILNNPIVEHIVMQTWNSIYSFQAKYYQTSSLYKILKADSVDYVLSTIKGAHTRQPSHFKSFQESFLIWNGSMKVKYYSQIFLFVFFTIFFQMLNNVFVINLRPKISIGINLRQTTKYWLPAFNEYFNGTNFTLSEVSYYLTTQNATFISQYYTQMTPELSKNLSNIITWVTTIQEGMDPIKAEASLMLNATYIYLYGIVNILYRLIYRVKTGINIAIIDSQSILDLIIFVIILTRVIIVDGKFLALLNFENIDTYDDNIRISFVILMSVFFVCLWLKMIIYFKFSDKIGPLLRILELILIKLVYFLIIFMSEIFIFGCVGNLLFALDQTNNDYKGLDTSILATFRAMMNDFDFKNFDDDNQGIAALYLCVHIFVATVILLNFLIAILSNVHESFQKSSILLFQQEIILKKKELMPDQTYGALLLIPFPFNFINFIFLPIFLFYTSKKRLRKINKALLYVAYTPLFLIYLIIHTITQVILLPFTFLKLIYSAFYCLFSNSRMLMRKKPSCQDKLKKSLFCWCLIITFPIIAIYVIILDSMIYIRCLFQIENAELSYLQNEDFITPFILNRINEIFEGRYNKVHEVPCIDVIDDFVEQMKMSNDKYDFKNVMLFNTYSKESVTLVKEYSTFVKFVNNIKIKNKHDQEVIYKNLLIKLIESNVNYCNITRSVKRDGYISSSSMVSSKILPEENRARKSGYMEKSMTLVPRSDSDESDDDMMFDVQKEISRNSKARSSIVTFARLPKIFYKRLYMINIQDIKNAMDFVKNSEESSQTVQKIRSDLKLIKKHVIEISESFNIKELMMKRKISRLSVRRARQSIVNNGRSSIVGKSEESPRPSDFADHQRRFNAVLPPIIEKRKDISLEEN